jgi:hypothetical protein
LGRPCTTCDYTHTHNTTHQHQTPNIPPHLPTPYRSFWHVGWQIHPSPERGSKTGGAGTNKQPDRESIETKPIGRETNQIVDNYRKYTQHTDETLASCQNHHRLKSNLRQ